MFDYHPSSPSEETCTDSSGIVGKVQRTKLKWEATAAANGIADPDHVISPRHVGALTKIEQEILECQRRDQELRREIRSSTSALASNRKSSNATDDLETLSSSSISELDQNDDSPLSPAVTNCRQLSPFVNSVFSIVRNDESSLSPVVNSVFSHAHIDESSLAPAVTNYQQLSPAVTSVFSHKVANYVSVASATPGPGYTRFRTGSMYLQQHQNPLSIISARRQTISELNNEYSNGRYGLKPLIKHQRSAIQKEIEEQMAREEEYKRNRRNTIHSLVRPGSYSHERPLTIQPDAGLLCIVGSTAPVVICEKNSIMTSSPSSASSQNLSSASSSYTEPPFFPLTKKIGGWKSEHSLASTDSSPSTTASNESRDTLLENRLKISASVYNKFLQSYKIAQ